VGFLARVAWDAMGRFGAARVADRMARMSFHHAEERGPLVGFLLRPLPAYPCGCPHEAQLHLRHPEKHDPRSWFRSCWTCRRKFIVVAEWCGEDVWEVEWKPPLSADEIRAMRDVLS
jgi:hypothetical protein